MSELKEFQPRTESVDTNIEMYQLLNDEPLTEQDLQRLESAKENITKTAKERVEKGLSSSDSTVKTEALASLYVLPEKQRVLEILKAGKDNDPYIAISAIKQIRFIPDAKTRFNVLKTILQNCAHKTSVQILREVYWLSPKDRLAILQIAMKKELAVFAIGQTRLLEPEDRFKFLKDNINKIDELELHHIIEEVPNIPLPNRWRLIELVLKNKGNDYIIYDILRQIKHLPDQEKKKSMETVLYGDYDDSIKSSAIKQAIYLPKKEQRKIIRNFFNSDSRIIKEASISLAISLPKQEAQRIIYAALSDPHEDIRKVALQQINILPKEEQIKIIKDIFIKDQSPLVRVKALQVAKSLLPENLPSLLPLLDRYQDRYTRASVTYVKNSIQVKKDEQVLSPEKLRAKIDGYNPLYRGAKNKFFRKNFPKTGSKTTLLGEIPGIKERSLRERLIIRHIPFDKFNKWLLAYQNVDTWRRAGFDYIPIEPIVYANWDNSDNPLMIRVYSRVIPGPTYDWWMAHTDNFKQEIEEKIKSIINTLKKLHLSHTHEHTKNFVLLFPRDAKNQPDYTKIPRVYMIDFDAIENYTPTNDDKLWDEEI